MTYKNIKDRHINKINQQIKKKVNKTTNQKIHHIHKKKKTLN